ncbi:hypothetical protein D3C74_491760 [compost metagenome]
MLQYDTANRRLAFAEAERLRGEGRSVLMRHVREPKELIGLPGDAAGVERTGPLGPLYGEIRTLVSF